MDGYAYTEKGTEESVYAPGRATQVIASMSVRLERRGFRDAPFTGFNQPFPDEFRDALRIQHLSCRRGIPRATPETAPPPRSPLWTR
jgi:hypothetical protein